MDRLDEIMEEVQATQSRIQALAASGPRPLSFACRHGGQVVVSEDASKPGRWRATRIDEHGEPTGHTEAGNFHEALKSAHYRGAVIP